MILTTIMTTIMTIKLIVIILLMIIIIIIIIITIIIVRVMINDYYICNHYDNDAIIPITNSCSYTDNISIYNNYDDSYS